MLVNAGLMAIIVVMLARAAWVPFLERIYFDSHVLRDPPVMGEAKAKDA
jgi:hypothetical protein